MIQLTLPSLLQRRRQLLQMGRSRTCIRCVCITPSCMLAHMWFVCRTWRVGFVYGLASQHALHRSMILGGKVRACCWCTIAEEANAGNIGIWKAAKTAMQNSGAVQVIGATYQGLLRLYDESLIRSLGIACIRMLDSECGWYCWRNSSYSRLLLWLEFSWLGRSMPTCMKGGGS